MVQKAEVGEIIEAAIRKKASDIFFLPREKKYRLLFRLTNEIVEIRQYNDQDGREIINYLKYAAHMDIAEHRRPQVGAMVFHSGTEDFYLRLSSIGDFSDRESLVIRLIYQIEQSRYFIKEQLQMLKTLCRRRGLIVTSGPTGSGKTTTMYELAKEIGQEKMVMTIEDPVEVRERTFLQTQVNVEAGISYTELLKAALRHRPDILIIGEIRDKGTARLAIDAALSGHLVLATVHAKSTLQTLARLKGLGVKNDELFNCLTAVSYQRLLPRKDGRACLLDIASGLILRKELIEPKGQEFVAWQQNLQKLVREGKINEKTKQQYQQG